jgi:putative membrane protein
VKELIAGGKQLASGTQKLADGMPALASGIAKVADGADQLASGVDSLGAGLISASSGADKLADGMSEFADGIAKGKDKLPSYTKAERQNLADVVASPVATEGLEGLADPNVGWVSLLAVVALWLGALGTYTVVRAVARGLLGSAESTPKLIAKALLPGLVVVGVQAVLLGALVHVGLGLAWPKTFEVTGVLLVAAAAFAVLNHALVALMGGFGRLLAVVFAVVTTASTVVAAAPGALTALRPFSPLTPALDAVRAVLTESSGAAASTWLVVGWLLLGLLGSAIAITRRRTTTLAAAVVG